MEEAKKKNNLLVVLLLLLLIASCGFIVYDKFVKKNEVNGNNTKDTMSNELAVAVAKEKLYEANHFFGFDSFMCDKDRIKDDFYCYYGSLENLEDKFYEIYSSKLSLKDVFVEYDSKTKKTTTNIKKSEFYDNDRIVEYLVQDDDVWVDTSCRASGGYYDLIDYKLENVTSDRIEVSYIEREVWEDYLFNRQNDGKSEQELKTTYNDLSKMTRQKIVLVNENNEWKILSASIKNNCGFGYNVGK